MLSCYISNWLAKVLNVHKWSNILLKSSGFIAVVGSAGSEGVDSGFVVSTGIDPTFRGPAFIFAIPGHEKKSNQNLR